jgi:hypothetical protein
LSSSRQDGTVPQSLALGYSPAILADLHLAYELVERIIKEQPWVDSKASGGSGTSAVMDKRTGVYSYIGKASATPANTMVNALLTLYSNSSAMFCAKNELPYPVAWENKDRVNSNIVRRFATQPLRNWLAQLQQYQLRAALKMNNPLTKSDCALAVSHVNSRRQQSQTFKALNVQQSSFEAFVNHCEAFRASTGGSSDIDFAGEVSLPEGEDGRVVVRLKDFGVSGALRVKNTFKRGDMVRVKVKKINYDTSSILFDLLN